MIEDRTILCFASGYDAPPTSKHHVMHALAERNTVLWVNYHASRAPTASSSDMFYMARKLLQVLRGMRRPRPNLYVLTPLVVPLPGRPWARRLNRRMVALQIANALWKIRTGPLQIWSFTPDISYLLNDLNPERVLYYCVDDHASFSGYDRDQVLRDERDLCRRSDLVVTTSTVLQQAKEPLNEQTLLVPHGVDFEHFSRAVREELPEPADLSDIPRPRLGFFGLIRDWVDLDLLAEAAKRKADWHFVLLGDSAVDLAPYRGISNLHFLGRKPYSDLPAYCRAFDVGLIPFQVNELTHAVNPIKLREYLAAGLPVVSTPMPEVQRYSNLIEIADSTDAFVAAVERCLQTGPDETTRRVDAMKQETWPAKVDLICERLLEADQLSPAGS
jgi:glycosyltransferase involved in cell wall biosynthesis